MNESQGSVRGGRRGGVSASVMTEEDATNYEKVVIPKVCAFGLCECCCVAPAAASRCVPHAR